jgi:hypothetical protein
MARETSKQAFQEILESGALGESQKKVFQAIFEAGDATGRELNDRLQSQSAHKRLSELQDMGLIREFKTRPCRVTGHDSIAWEITGSMPKPRTPAHTVDTPTRKEFEEGLDMIRRLIAYYKARNPEWTTPESLVKVGTWLKRKTR